MDEAKLKSFQAVVFDWLRMEEAAHPLMIVAVEHYRDLVNQNLPAILAELKGKGLA